MNNKSILLACISTFALLGASMSIAGNRPGAVTFTAAEAYYHFAAKRSLDGTGMPNIALAYNFNDRLAVEGGAGLLNSNSRGHDDYSVHGYLYTVDGLYRFKPFLSYEPYISAGLGVLSLKPNDNDPTQQGNINVGIGSQFFIDRSIALRLEAKDVYTFAGGKNDYLINLGLSFVLGGCDHQTAFSKGQNVYPK